MCQDVIAADSATSVDGSSRTKKYPGELVKITIEYKRTYMSYSGFPNSYAADFEKVLDF